jgi:hypothetical protein
VALTLLATLEASILASRPATCSAPKAAAACSNLARRQVGAALHNNMAKQQHVVGLTMERSPSYSHYTKDCVSIHH